MPIKKVGGTATAAAPAKIVAAAVKAATNGNGGVSFLKREFYVAGGGLPEGDYCLYFFNQMYQAMKQSGQPAGPPRLGCMVHAYNLHDFAEKPRTQFYSFGTNAHQSFMPTPDGKGLMPVPNGPATHLPKETNWDYFLNSLYDCGLPENVADNDYSVSLDGVHVHTQNIPEPEGRKSMVSAKTSEVEQPDNRRNNSISIVSIIHPDGKPWEGTGGLPTGMAIPTVASAAKLAAQPQAPVARPVAARPAAPVSNVALPEGVTEDEVRDLAIATVTKVLEKNPEGLARVQLKTDSFTLIEAEYGSDVNQACQALIFSQDDQLRAIIEGLGYKFSGLRIAVA